MRTSKFIFLAISALVFSACSKDPVIPDEEDAGEETPQEGVFVLAATKSLAGADILYTSSSLDEGTIATSGTGVEQNGSSRNYLVHNGLFFSLLFGQGSPGAVTAYKINTDKQLEKVTDFQTETMTASAPVGDDILMVKNAWQPEEEYTKWYRFDTKSLQIVAQGEINANELAGNGEKAFFTSLMQVGSKVFAPFWSVESGRSFSTKDPDMTHIAVYSYPDMKLEKVIRDARSGSIGAYFTSGIEVDEDGDAYVIGTKLGPDMAGEYSTVTPVAFMKIKAGTTEYDKSYFFNVTEASGGKYIFKKLYLGKGNFLLTMADKAERYATTMGLSNPISFAIANVYDTSFKWVTGAPEPSSIYRTTEYSYNYSPLDGKTGYLGINVLDMATFTVKAVVYKFDAETATATPGLTTDGQGGFTSVNWVPVTN